MSAFLEGKTVLITGGTGSFGLTALQRLSLSKVANIRIFSRDEAKQDVLGRLYPRATLITGDVRDLSALTKAMKGCHYVFHAAALKQVPNCERHPTEAIKTNVLGAINLVEAAEECRPEAVVALSTDKAVEPLSTMGFTKALMEKVILNTNCNSRMICVRYGNVIASRGSVIPLFLEQIRRGKPLTITHPEMTRFLLKLEDSVELVLDAMRDGKNGELWVKQMPAATVATIAHACLKITGSKLPVEVIGTRPGEKMHEVLLNSEELSRAVSGSQHFWVGRDRLREINPDHRYTSQNTHQIGIDDVVHMLAEAGLP